MTGLLASQPRPKWVVMQQAGQMAQRAVSTMPGESADTWTKSSLRSLDKAWTSALFSRFEGIWGNAWTDKFRSERMMEIALEEWAIGLYGLSGEHIKRGLDAARAHCKWPPSIAEFLDLALDRGNWEHKSEAYKPAQLALPKPRNPEIAKGGFKAMRDVLNKN